MSENALTAQQNIPLSPEPKRASHLPQLNIQKNSESQNPLIQSAKNLFQHPLVTEQQKNQPTKRQTLPFKIFRKPKLPPSKLLNPYLINLCKKAVVREKKELPHYKEILQKINHEFGIEENKNEGDLIEELLRNEELNIKTRKRVFGRPSQIGGRNSKGFLNLNTDIFKSENSSRHRRVFSSDTNMTNNKSGISKDSTS